MKKSRLITSALTFVFLAVSAWASPRLLDPSVCGLSHAEQKVYLDRAEREIRENGELKQLAFLLESSHFVSTAHGGGTLPAGYFTLGIKSYGSEIRAEMQAKVIVVSYAQPLKSTYDFVFDRKKKLISVFCIPEG